jgi:hypothetical protein
MVPFHKLDDLGQGKAVFHVELLDVFLVLLPLRLARLPSSGLARGRLSCLTDALRVSAVEFLAATGAALHVNININDIDELTCRRVGSGAHTFLADVCPLADVDLPLFTWGTLGAEIHLHFAGRAAAPFLQGSHPLFTFCCECRTTAFYTQNFNQIFYSFILN